MMMPTIPSTSSYPGGAISSSSAVVLVDKATSEFLLAPDWTVNIDICDTVNSNHWLAKDVVKAVKKRLQHKNPKVQLLALTLTETMVKNCGDNMHFQIADRNILQDMVKIVKKKADMHVRDKILLLLDSWQEAFGGAGGKYPQYYWAYEELRRSGVAFPQRSVDTAPIFTPPPTHTTPRNPQPGYGMPSNSSARLDEAMAAEDQNLSLSLVQSMRNVLDLLADMLQALNPKDRSAVKDEVIVDLVEQCRSNQKKLMQMLTTTRDEELLGQGLDLNDSMQNVLARHDAIASGMPLPIEDTYSVGQTSDNNDFNGKPTDITTGDTTSAVNSVGPGLPLAGTTHEGEEEEDDFLQLARRHSKTLPSASLSTPSESCDTTPLVNADSKMVSQGVSSSVSTCNAIVPVDMPAPVSSTKEQDIIDLLSITLSGSMSSEEKSETPVSSSQNPYQGPSPNMEGNNPYASEAYHVNQDPRYHSYIAPWAKAAPQHQVGPQSQLQQPAAHNPSFSQPQNNSPFYGQNWVPQQVQSQSNPQLSGYSTVYPPPPWAATPGYFRNPNPGYTYSSAQATLSTPTPLQGSINSQTLIAAARGTNAPTSRGESQATTIPRSIAPVDGQKPFIPSYRLFEELNVLGSTDGNFSTTSNTSSALLGSNSHSMVRGAK